MFRKNVFKDEHSSAITMSSEMQVATDINYGDILSVTQSDGFLRFTVAYSYRCILPLKILWLFGLKRTRCRAVVPGYVLSTATYA